MAGKKIFTDHEYQTSAHLVTPKVHTVANISSHAGVLGQLAASGSNLYFHDGSNWFSLIESNYAGALTGKPNFDPASGNVPFTVGTGHTDKVDNLNADLLDGYDTSTSAVASKIPVYGTSGVLKVGTPSDDLDAANKQYVDNAVEGLDIKASVAAASTGNLTLSGTQTVDGVSLSAGNRVLVKDQSTASQNGIYIVASGSWSLAEDSDAGSLSEGAYVFVEAGTVNNNTGWTYTDSTAYTWVKFSGAGQLVAGDGLVKSGDTLSANVASPISIVSDQITIADAAITGAKLANNTVTSTQLADSIQLNHIGLGVAPDTTYRLKTTGKSRLYNTTDFALLAETTGSNTAIFNATSAPPNYIVDFRLAGNSKVRIEPDGDLHAVEKIGIGITPSHRLHIKDNADTGNGGIAIERSSTSDKGYLNMRGGRLGLVTETALPIKFYTDDTSRLEIDGSSGDVKVISKLGIGVTPSLYHLHVASGNKLLAGGYTFLERTTTVENANVLYVQSTGTDSNQELATFTYGATAGGVNTGNETFVVARAASYFYSKLGIGVSPSHTLDVNGDIHTDAVLRMTRSGTFNLYPSSNNVVYELAQSGEHIFKTDNTVYFTIGSGGHAQLTDKLTIGNLATSTTDTNVIVESSGLLKKRATHPGAFSAALTQTPSNLNSVSSGWHKWGSSSNKPVNSPNQYMVMLQQQDGNQPIQLAYGGSSYGKLFIRRKDSGTYYDWTEFYNTENLTLSTLGGVGGSGTDGKIPIWSGNTTTLGDSVITQSNGNVGIGTEVPIGKLHIYESGGSLNYLEANPSTEDANIGNIYGRWNGKNTSLISFRSGSDTTNKDNGDIVFYTSTAGGSLVRAMTIDENQKVGIGISSNISAKLHVIGDIASTTRVAVDTVNGYTGGSTPLTIRTGGAQGLFLGTNNTNRVEVTSAGAVKATRDGGANLIQVARIFDGSLTGNGSATSFTITHNLETPKPIAAVIDHTTGAYVEAQIVVALDNDNAITVTFNNAPASGKVYRVPVTG